MSSKQATGLDLQFLNQVIEDGGADARRLLAVQAAGLLKDSSAPAIERQQILSIALRLAKDDLKEVRESLAQELVEVANLPADLVFAIVSDETSIARPFLETTRSLTSTSMIAVLKAGDTFRQCIVARRPDLSRDAVAHIVRQGAQHPVLALLDNPSIELDDDALRTIYQRLGNTEEVAERLLAMPDLPPDLRVTQARRTASRMMQLLAEKNWLGNVSARELIAESEEMAILHIILESDGRTLESLMTFLAAKNLLTPSLIVRAAASGEMKAVESILQHLTGASASRTRDLLYHRGASGFRSLYNKSGLPHSCFGLVRASCDVAYEVREEGYVPSKDAFGRRVLEALMTRYEELTPADRAKQIEYLSRYGEDGVKKIARRLKSDLLRAA